MTRRRCCVRQVSLVVGALWGVALAANLPVVFSYRIKTYVQSASLNATDVLQPYSYCGIEDETRADLSTSQRRVR